jgi:branched-chain amino acid transport system permease protein
MVILGGSGSITGAIVGGVFVTFTVKLIEQLQGLESIQAIKAVHPDLDLNALRMVIYASVLIGLMILRPEGLFGEREPFRRARKQKIAIAGGEVIEEAVPATTEVEQLSEHPTEEPAEEPQVDGGETAPPSSTPTPPGTASEDEDKPAGRGSE